MNGPERRAPQCGVIVGAITGVCKAEQGFVADRRIPIFYPTPDLSLLVLCSFPFHLFPGMDLSSSAGLHGLLLHDFGGIFMGTILSAVYVKNLLLQSSSSGAAIPFSSQRCLGAVSVQTIRYFDVFDRDPLSIRAVVCITSVVVANPALNWSLTPHYTCALTSYRIPSRSHSYGAPRLQFLDGTPKYLIFW